MESIFVSKLIPKASLRALETPKIFYPDFESILGRFWIQKRDPKWSQNDPQIEQNTEKYTGNQILTPKNALTSDLGPKMKPK